MFTTLPAVPAVPVAPAVHARVAVLLTLATEAEALIIAVHAMLLCAQASHSTHARASAVHQMLLTCDTFGITCLSQLHCVCCASSDLS